MEMKSSDVDDININKKKWNRLLSMNENLELYLIFFKKICCFLPLFIFFAAFPFF